MKAVVLVACVVLFVTAASADVRTWKDKSGKFSIQGELVESDGNAVKLKKADGKVIQVPLERLSDEDRQFLETQRDSAFTGTPATSGAAGKGVAGAPGLRYGWKPGRQYLYRVKIEVDLGDEVLELSGNPQYSVRSADKDRAVLAFRGTLMEHTRSKGGGPVGIPRGPRGPGRMGGPPSHGSARMHSHFSPMTGVGPFGMARETELTVDPLGVVARQEGTSQLPFLMGNLAQLMIEHLPATPQQTWTAAHGSGIIIKEEGIPHFGPRANDEGFVPAAEKTIYTVESSTDKAVVIRKQYEFKAAATGSDKPPFEISGDGKYTFDKAEGVSGTLDFSMKVTFRKGGLSAEVPVKVTYHLIDEAEQATMAKAAQEAEAERKKPLEGNEVADVVADLTSGKKDRLTRALRQIVMKTPDKPDEQIAKALEELVLSDQDNGLRSQAAKALEKWSTPANVPGLIKALDDKTVRASAIKALVKYKASEAIEPISKQLDDLFTRGPAVEFLKAMGPAAEPAVAKQLESLAPAVRKEAALILKEIGTVKSTAALEKATSDPDGWVKRAAQEALDAIKKRSR